MRYFDSPKNKAFWEKEMVGLRKKRAEREAGGFPEQSSREQLHDRENSPVRIRVTYEELLKMEAEALGTAREQKRKRPVKEKEKSMERSMEL